MTDSEDEGSPPVAARPPEAKTLYVVATPLGNLRDITLRALDTLRAVDCIAAEDTRVSAVLLARYGLSARCISLHQHNEALRAGKVIGLLERGESVALITDAGTPAISDPGALLVRAVRAAGYAVVPIPGPSAVTAALSIAGIATSGWLFCGFLPASAKARRDAIKRVALLPFALVFYEAPHRIVAAVADLAQELQSDRTVVIARELTKRYEAIHQCRLEDAPAWLSADSNRQRGEFVLVLEAPLAEAKDPRDEHDRVLGLLLAELPLARAVRVACALTGAPRNQLYARALELAGSLSGPRPGAENG